MSTKTDMSPGNYHDTTVSQNSEPVRSKRNIHKEKELTTIEDKKTIFILGEGMVKHVEGWELSSFSSAKVKCIKDFVKPCIRNNNPDHVIIHVGTKELDSESQVDMTATSIIDL